MPKPQHLTERTACPMDLSLLQCLARELNDRWRGAWVQQAWQDVHGRVVLQLRSTGQERETRYLVLSPLPHAQGFGTLHARPACPPRPPSLAAYLRAHVCGGRLEAAECASDDRVVKLLLLGRPGVYQLILEATGRRGNLVIADPEGVVRAAWRWEPAESHPLRPLEPGRAYAPPPRTGPLSVGGDEHRDPAELRNGGPDRAPLDSAGRALEELLGQVRAREEAAAALAWAGAERKRLGRRLEKIRQDLARLDDPALLRRKADALAAGLWRVNRGDAEVLVPDPRDPAEQISLALDPAAGPGENLDRLYERARRAERARRVLEARAEDTRTELEALGRGECLQRPAKQSEEASRQPYRRVRASNGWAIWVGRNGKENDRLLREARPWDLWFHARAAPGAHVLLRLPGREAKVPETVLLEAAEFAARYSRSAGDGAVDVMVAEAGRVRKPKGASPGRVVVAGERTVRVRPRVESPGLPSR